MIRKRFRFLSKLFLPLFLLSCPNPVPALEMDSIPQVRYLPWPTYEGTEGETLYIVKHTSQVLRFDRSVVRAAISNPSICDIVPLGKEEILIYCERTGRINLIVWDGSYQVASYDIQATVDQRKLYEVFSAIDPTAELEIVPFEESFAIYGTAETSLKVKKIRDAAVVFDAKAMSFVRVKEPKQILLEVRFAEVNRKANLDYGLDLDLMTNRFARMYSLLGATGAVPKSSSPLFTVEASKGFRPRDSIIDYFPLNAATSSSLHNIGGGYVSAGKAIQYFLRWLEQKNILKIMARPNLLTRDGEEAKFLVGGETPVVTSNTNGTTVNYKEFGTRLNFTPEIIDDGVIQLKTETEVSELDFTQTVTVSGTTVPSLLRRHHQNVSALRDNETLVIGGMLTQRVNRIKRYFPILGQIPFLDRFFSRDEFSRTDVELLVVVTPHIVKPFQLGEKKILYNPEEVQKAARLIAPPYPDAQGDTINQLFIQEEGYRDFLEEDKVLADKIMRDLIREKRRKKAAEKELRLKEAEERKRRLEEKSRLLKEKMRLMEERKPQREAERKKKSEEMKRRREEEGKKKREEKQHRKEEKKRKKELAKELARQKKSNQKTSTVKTSTVKTSTVQK